jgi:hypothetical protein
MFIVKPEYSIISLKDVKENIELKDYPISLCYSDGETLGYIYRIDQDEKYIKDIFDWINAEKMPALIHIDQHGMVDQQPFFINNNRFALCFDIRLEKDYKKHIFHLEKILNLIKDPTIDPFSWLFREAFDRENPLCIMQSDGTFIFENTWCKYIDNGLHYCSSGRPYKNYTCDDIDDYYMGRGFHMGRHGMYE